MVEYYVTRTKRSFKAELPVLPLHEVRRQEFLQSFATWLETAAEENAFDEVASTIGAINGLFELKFHREPFQG